MPRLRSRAWPWALLWGVVWCALSPLAYTHAATTDPGRFMDEAENLRTADHPRFVQMLAQIHREGPPLTGPQQWRLRYLDAWETMFQGDYSKSEAQLKDVVDHSGDAALSAKATALLLTSYSANHRYEEAFALANLVTSKLPAIKDQDARSALLQNLSQMFNLAGQIDLAIQYAHMLEEAMPPGANLCRPQYMQAAALYNGKRLTAASADLKRAIDSCTAARQPVYANALWLILGSLYLDESRPREALELLDRIAPSLRTNHYYLHTLSAQVQRAQAHEKLGDDLGARKAALAAIAMGNPDDVNEWLKEAYEVLYRVEKRAGNADAALAYYERFVVQDKGYLDDISARTLAYETARQHTLVQQLETESLSKQNNILRLQQALNSKAMETSRLYIALLIVVLVSIVLWLFRVKRSQLRFKRLSCLDGLTGIFNHQHFIGEAGRALNLMERKQGTACLISIDLDHFKQINDTHGHAMGDAALKRTVSVCRQLLRPNDLFGRLGGEEFGILLLDRTCERGTLIAERLRQAIEMTPITETDCLVPLSASIGVASTARSGYGLQRLCRDADAALYRAKRGGRNRVVADGDVVDMGALVA